MIQVPSCEGDSIFSSSSSSLTLTLAPLTVMSSSVLMSTHVTCKQTNKLKIVGATSNTHLTVMTIECLQWMVVHFLKGGEGREGGKVCPMYAGEGVGVKCVLCMQGREWG